MLKQYSMLALATSLSACASLPDVTYSYYQTKSVTAFTVTQNLQCVKDPDAKDPKTHKLVTKYTELDVTASIPAPLTTYSADYGQGPSTLKISNLDGSLSDTDSNFTFLEDGRLAGMNVNLTGEGETILKSAISLGVAAAGFAGATASADHKIDHPTINQICTQLSGRPGADKLALTFTRVVDFGAKVPGWRKWKADKDEADKEGKPEPFPPPTIVLNAGDDIGVTVSDPDLYAYLKSASMALPEVRVDIGAVSQDVRVATYDEKTSGDVVRLTLQDTASVQLDYSVYDREKKRLVSGTNSNVITVPLSGSPYYVAIPKGKAFGTGKVVLALSPSGAITNLEYSKTNGAAGPMNVATAAFTAATPAATTPTSSDTTSPPPNTKPNISNGPQTKPNN
jgi:hypothetical protein